MLPEKHIPGYCPFGLEGGFDFEFFECGEGIGDLVEDCQFVEEGFEGGYFDVHG